MDTIEEVSEGTDTTDEQETAAHPSPVKVTTPIKSIEASNILAPDNSEPLKFSDLMTALDKKNSVHDTATAWMKGKPVMLEDTDDFAIDLDNIDGPALDSCRSPEELRSIPNPIPKPPRHNCGETKSNSSEYFEFPEIESFEKRSQGGYKMNWSV